MLNPINRWKTSTVVLVMLVTAPLMRWGSSFAQEAALEKPLAPGLPSVAASDEAAIRAMVGKEVRVRGFVETTVRGGSGVQILKFKGAELAVVIFKSYVGKFKDGEPADLFKGKTVEVSGELEIYKKGNQPQIKLRDPAQITVIAAGTGKSDGSASGENSKATGRKGKSKSTVDFRKYFCE